MVLEKDTFQIENKENECKKYQIFLNVKRRIVSKSYLPDQFQEGISVAGAGNS